MAKIRILTDNDLNTTLPTLDEKGKVLAEQIPEIGGTNLSRDTSNPIEYDMLATDHYKEYITNVKLEPDIEYTLSFVAERLSQDSVPIALTLGGGNSINIPYRTDYLPRFRQEVKLW